MDMWADLNLKLTSPNNVTVKLQTDIFKAELGKTIIDLFTLGATDANIRPTDEFEDVGTGI